MLMERMIGYVHVLSGLVIYEWLKKWILGSSVKPGKNGKYTKYSSVYGMYPLSSTSQPGSQKCDSVWWSCCDNGVAFQGGRPCWKGEKGEEPPLYRSLGYPQSTQTGLRFALGPALFADRAHTGVVSVEVLETPVHVVTGFQKSVALVARALWSSCVIIFV